MFKGNPRKLSCIVSDIEVPLERDWLEFDLNGENVTAFTYVWLSTKQGDRGFTTFPAEIFEIFPYVDHVSIQSNLKVLSQNDWKNAINLKTLRLSGNKLSEFMSFNGLKNLKKLELEQNQLSIIRRDFLVGMDKLEELYLGQNGIHSIEDGSFDHANLIFLDLSRNNLTTLSDSVFSKCPKMRAVEIGHNQLTHIGQSMYSLQHVTLIGLSFNHIEDIDLAEFSKMPRLKSLLLESSGFSFVSTSGVSSDQSNNTALELLNIEKNNLTNLDFSKLKTFNGLKSLCILGNPLIKCDQLSAAEIKRVFPNLEKLGWNGAGWQSENFNILTNQLNHLNVTVVMDDKCW